MIPINTVEKPGEEAGSTIQGTIKKIFKQNHTSITIAYAETRERVSTTVYVKIFVCNKFSVVIFRVIELNASL